MDDGEVRVHDRRRRAGNLCDERRFVALFLGRPKNFIHTMATLSEMRISLRGRRGPIAGWISLCSIVRSVRDPDVLHTKM